MSIKLPVINVKKFGAVGDGVTDDTAAINSAISAGKHVYIPSGVYKINTLSGVIVRSGLTLFGDGRDASILLAASGASGSVIKRNTPTGAAQYIQDILIRDIGVVLNHAYPATPTGYFQVAFDFRHITRSKIVDCYAGNYNRGSAVSGFHTDPPSGSDGAQGYGVLLGNVSSSDPIYSGGEVNIIENVSVWGAKKAICLDDATLNPASASHATIVKDCDVQVCEGGIVEESIYTAGCSFNNNTIQAVTPATSSSNTTYAYRIEGYGNTVGGGYIEVQNICDFGIKLGSLSSGNYVNSLYISENVTKTTLTGAIASGATSLILSPSATGLFATGEAIVVSGMYLGSPVRKAATVSSGYATGTTTLTLTAAIGQAFDASAKVMTYYGPNVTVSDSGFGNNVVLPDYSEFTVNYGKNKFIRALSIEGSTSDGTWTTSVWPKTLQVGKILDDDSLIRFPLNNGWQFGISSSKIDGRLRLLRSSSAGNDQTGIPDWVIDPAGRLGLYMPNGLYPEALVHLGTGSSTPLGAPLKFSVGNILTTPEVGAIEYNGTNLFYSTSTPVRKTIANLNDDQVVSGNWSIGIAGKGLLVKEGSNATMGSVALTAGSATVSTTKVTANSRIYLTSQVDGGTPGFLRVSARNTGTDFTITSSSGTDTSTVAWLIVEPA